MTSDHFNELFEWDQHGNKRRKRVARDRERITFATISDQAGGFSATFADGSPDYTSPHRKGFRFADVNDAARIAADQAYEARCEHIDYRHRQQNDAGDHGSRQRTLDALEQRTLDVLEQSVGSLDTLDELERAAIQAYEQRSARMRDAWKEKR